MSSLTSSATSYSAAASVFGISYASHGALSQQTLGNGLLHQIGYNQRLQPTSITLGSALSLSYSYGTTDNNGNIQSIGYYGGGIYFNQTFSYDSLNRLATAQENAGASWTQTNGYDRYGNRTVTAGIGQSLTFNTANNRIVGFTYDAAGNVTNDNVHGYAYDAENKIVKLDNVTAYVYDGDGKRVRKLVGENTRFVYGITGELLAEYNGSTGAIQKEYVYGASGLTATIEPTTGTQYLTADHLGSPRVITNSSGAVVLRRDFLPFGEQISSTIGGRTNSQGWGASNSIRQQFTGYQKDQESGLDFAQARYYGGSFGRFTSPDNFLNATRPENPATWNLYIYALNNPLKFIDPSGEIERDAKGNVIFHKTGEDTVKFKDREKLVDANKKEIKIAVMKDGKVKQVTAYRTISWKADLGYVKANDGTKIEASKATSGLKIEITDKNGNIFQEQTDATQKAYDEAGFNNTADCHGTTFASGQVWINDSEVEKLMIGDGYRQVGKKETIQAGDVGIYSTDGTLNPLSVRHSVTVNDVGATSVTSKGGITPLQPSIAPGPGPGTAWNPKENESVKLTYWTLRAKPKN